LGVAGLVFYGTLWAAAGSDVIATHVGVSIESQVHILRATLVIGPLLSYYLTRAICRGLQERERDVVEHGIETGRVIRRPDGGYVEVRRPLSDDERARRVEAHPAGEAAEPTPVRADRRASGPRRRRPAPAVDRRTTAPDHRGPTPCPAIEGRAPPN
jgi:ubiquinol-cytochrome c reductase cytochrome b subunit